LIVLHKEPLARGVFLWPGFLSGVEVLVVCAGLFAGKPRSHRIYVAHMINVYPVGARLAREGVRSATTFLKAKENPRPIQRTDRGLSR
jgi:hypothetical protein